MSGLTHLDELEAEAIYIIREVAAECEKPVMLYSIGKDSSVMLHLAMKAFYPEKPPFPFLHVNTTWKFREMIEFRDKTAKELGIEMLEYINEEGVKQGINPFDHGAVGELYPGGHPPGPPGPENRIRGQKGKAAYAAFPFVDRVP